MKVILFDKCGGDEVWFASNIFCHRMDHEVRGLPWIGPDTPIEPECLTGVLPGKVFPAASWNIILEAAMSRPTTMCPAKQKLNIRHEVFFLLSGI